MKRQGLKVYQTYRLLYYSKVNKICKAVEGVTVGD